MAKELGWYVVVKDGRSHLARRERFPLADVADVLAIKKANAPTELLLSSIRHDDVAILMSHSYEQDLLLLTAFFAAGLPVRYLGVLGPQRRTRELLAEAAALAGVAQERIPEQVDEWLGHLHAPTGLDLGAESPETVAISILAEIQKVLSRASARPLREVRAVRALPEATSTPTPTL
jgi:xanthine/CO dehydrogenase XdhC/CoxF family maturation factor